jgi:hypothetical protein
MPYYAIEGSRLLAMLQQRRTHADSVTLDALIA